MKKLLSSILCVLFLVSSAFATVDFSKPSDEIVAKIKTAVINDRNKVFHSLYWEGYPTVEYDVKTVHFVNVVANCNGNYVISFMFDDSCVDGYGYAFAGDYVAVYYSYGFGVYSSESDKLMSIPDAFKLGLITNEDMYEISKQHKGEEDPLTNFIFNKGDINKDAVVDITDVVIYRNYIVNGERRYMRFYSKIGDLNEDGQKDVTDIGMLRNIIVNGEGQLSHSK